MAGSNLVDLMELSSAKRQIVRLILRETMMTYDDLCESIRDLQHIEQTEIDVLLDDLTRNQWVIMLLRGQETVYRVNLVRKSAAQNQAFWNRLDRPTDLTANPEDRSMVSGGKRTLPSAIWDSLEGDQPLSREFLLNAIQHRKMERKESASELGRALRKRVFEALDAIAREDLVGKV